MNINLDRIRRIAGFSWDKKDSGPSDSGVSENAQESASDNTLDHASDGVPSDSGVQSSKERRSAERFAGSSIKQIKTELL